jgi:hypothetical protein
MPPVRILDNMRLPTHGYAIRIKEMEAGTGEVRLNHLMAMDPRGGQVDMPGEHVREPAFGLPATWIDDSLREEATFRGYTIVDPATVLTTHLTEILKENMADLLSYGEVQKLLKELPAEQKKLVEDLVPSVVSNTTLQRVLQALLKERVSIRDLGAILEGIAEAAPHTSSLTNLVEAVRTRLARQLCWQNKGEDGSLPIITLSGEWEQTFSGWFRRGQAVGAGPQPPAGLHPGGARRLRTRGAGGRRGGAAHRADHPALCPLDHRTLPRPDRGDESERDPPQGAVEDRRRHLIVPALQCGARTGSEKAPLATWCRSATEPPWRPDLLCGQTKPADPGIF